MLRLKTQEFTQRLDQLRLMDETTQNEVLGQFDIIPTLSTLQTATTARESCESIKKVLKLHELHLLNSNYEN